MCETSGDITRCPRITIMRDLLRSFQRFRNSVHTMCISEITDSLQPVLLEYGLNVIELINTIWHLETEHAERSDELFAFLSIPCSLSDCAFVHHHYRNRADQQSAHILMDDSDPDDVLLFDIMCSAHSFFLHSMDIERLMRSKGDHQAIDMKISCVLHRGGIHPDHEVERAQIIMSILSQSTTEDAMEIFDGIGNIGETMVLCSYLEQNAFDTDCIREDLEIVEDSNIYPIISDVSRMYE